MLHYYIPYERFRKILTEGGRRLEQELQELAEREALVEFKCSRCGDLYIAHFRPGLLNHLCLTCREAVAASSEAGILLR
jgi:predicted RNA-binding Zn-ribbon protein involved in translation (DUF1610 family)